jgi:ABC-type Mn2+/Zn2+ transport system permease subunit
VRDAVLQPWREAFVDRALAELLLLGVVGSAVGCWTVVYELSYSAESLAHALFPGLVVAALAGAPLLLGGALGVFAAAIGVAVVSRTPLIGRDASVAVVVTTLFGLGVLLALSRASPPGLDGLLFGELLGVSSRELAVSGALAGAALVAVALLYRPLLAVGFDRGSAPALGVRPLFVDLALLALIAAAILVGVRALGNLLVLALLIGPPAAARLLFRGLPATMAAAVAIAWAGSVAGLYVSYYADVAAGASVAGLIVLAYVAAMAVNGTRHIAGRRA